MSSGEDRQAEAIASEWGIDVSLLDGVEWTIDTIVSNDDHPYSYTVNFDKGTDPKILSALGLTPGDFSRQLSLNAFDQPDYSDEDYDRDLRIREGLEEIQTIEFEDEDGTFPIDGPLPDLPPGEAYLLDDNGSYLTDEKGRPLIATGQQYSGAVGGAPLGEYVLAGPTYAGRSFAGHSFAMGDRVVHGDGVEELRLEMLSRLDRLEALIRGGGVSTANRGHNHPPELIEVDRPISGEQFQELVTAIGQVKLEAQSDSPNTANVAAQVSVFQRVARSIARGTLWLAGAAIAGVVGQEAVSAYTAHKQQVSEALLAAADAVSAWLQHIPSMF